MHLNLKLNEDNNILIILFYFGVYYAVLTIVYLLCLSVGETPKLTDITGSVTDALIAAANITLACVAVSTAKKWKKEQTMKEVKEAYIAYSDFYNGTLRLVDYINQFISSTKKKPFTMNKELQQVVSTQVKQLLENREVFRTNMILCEKIHKIDTKSVYFKTALVENMLEQIEKEIINLFTKGIDILMTMEKNVKDPCSIFNLIDNLDIPNKDTDNSGEYISKKLTPYKAKVTLNVLHLDIENVFKNLL